MTGFKVSIALFALIGVSAVVAEQLTHIANICDAPGVDPLEDLLPHENDCTKFYKCDHGKPALFKCPDGLEWSSDDKVCDWPANAGCSTVLPCVPVRKPVCPEHDAHKPAVHLANPKDCGSFFKCDWGVAYLTYCPSTLHFNANLQVCDYPERANCACSQNDVAP